MDIKSGLFAVSLLLSGTLTGQESVQPVPPPQSPPPVYVIDAYIFTGEIPTEKSKVMLTGDTQKVYDLEKDVKFSIRSTIPPEDISLVVSTNRKDAGGSVYTFVPYLVQPETVGGVTVYGYFYGLGKFDEGDRVSLAVTKKSDNNMIVYRSEFYAPIRRWFNFESGVVRFIESRDLRGVVGIRVFPSPRDIDLDLTYNSFQGIIQHISIYVGASVTNSMFVQTEVGTEQAYLLGATWEVNRYFAFSGGRVFFSDSALNDQWYAGITVNNDLFGELIGRIVK